MKDLSIGWISAAAYATTGYGRICKEVVGRLIRDGWNIVNIGGIGGTTVWGGKMNYPSKIYREHDHPDILADKAAIEEIEIPIVPTVGHLTGKDVMPAFLSKYKLDLIITHWDSFAIDYIQHLPIPAINYLPIDAPFTSKMYGNIEKSHKVIAFSKFGYRELMKWLPFTRTGYIPHGINTDEWSPLDRKRVREEVFGADENQFIIVTNGANVGERKQLPLMLKIFKKFLKTHPDSILYMFTNPTVMFPKGYDLIAMMHSLGIEKNVFYPKYDPVIEPWSNQQLCELYSAADVYLTTTLGEGFGIPILESMSCGTPVIGPNNSTMPELIRGHGWIADICDDYEFIPVWIPTLQSYPVPSMKSILHCLDDAYNHPDKVKEYGKKSREFALHYDWKKIIPMWEDLLLQTEEYINIFKKRKS